MYGITGKIGAGKTTVADYLCREHGKTAYALSDPIKKVAIVLGFLPHQVYGTQAQKLEINETWGISGRQFMQKFGTDVCRDFLPTAIPEMSQIWIQCFRHAVRENPDIVLSDVRFPDEARAVKEMRGKIIRVVRDNDEKHNDSVHASELAMDDIPADFVIRNTGSLSELYQKINDIVLSESAHSKSQVE